MYPTTPFLGDHNGNKYQQLICAILAIPTIAPCGDVFCHSFNFNKSVYIYLYALQILHLFVIHTYLIKDMDLLAKDGSVTIHTRNLKVFATEMFMVHKNMSTELMQEVFCVRQTHYSLKNPHRFTIPGINSVYHGSDSISNLSDLDYGT